MDSNLPSWPEGLDTPLQERKHTILPRSAATRMESGRSRVRRMQLEPLEVMDVTWNFTADAYEVFRDFFINDLEHGSLFFTMETMEPTDDVGFYYRTTRSYAFLDGRYTFNESDNLFTVSATLEIDEEEQERFPPSHINVTVADGATTSATFHDGELLPSGEEVSTSAGFLSGLNFLAIVLAPEQGETGASGGGFLNGVYLITVETITHAETGSSLAGFQSGVFSLVVVVDTESEDTSSSAGFQSGAYVQVVADTTQSENTSSTAGFQSGAYTLF